MSRAKPAFLCFHASTGVGKKRVSLITQVNGENIITNARAMFS
jgi:hypothetical protein